MIRKIRHTKLKIFFYIMIGIMGWTLLLIDTTLGHDLWNHLYFFKNNLDAVEGILFIFISAFELGKLIK